MEYTWNSGTNTITMTGCDSFDITAILECGQCFRFIKMGDMHYSIVACGRQLFIRQTGCRVEFYPTGLEDFENIWINYFDIHRDYSRIKNELSAYGDVMRAAVEFAPGIRHLRQERFECLISFIISQNNRIPMIMKSVQLISEKYGTCFGDGLYAFPTPAQLAEADIIGLMGCKVGFRAKYIMDAVNKIVSGDIDLEKCAGLPTAELREELKKIKGVGDKIADCVMVFSYGRSEVFPTDVWIIRTMRKLFFDGTDVSLNEIHDFAYKRFGTYAGMANQYIYHYARMNGLCAKAENKAV